MKHRNYLFSVGNSTDGPVGACLRACARSKIEAVGAARALIAAHTLADESVEVYGGDRAYLIVYLNGDALRTKDIEESEPCDCSEYAP